MKSYFLSTAIFLLTFNLGVGQTDFYQSLSDSAWTLTLQEVLYDPSYYSLTYPNGDVPSNRGVCTDVVIRAYRKLGIDLQKEVHEDMSSAFDQYPNIWGLQRTDKNIDHRRVPNLMTFFQRKGISNNISHKAQDYQAGDIVCWKLPQGATHIGIVSSIRAPRRQRLMIVHNIGSGQVIEDMLFDFEIIGHYRYNPLTDSDIAPQ